MKINVMTIVLIAGLFAGCESTHRSTTSASLNTRLKTQPLNAEIEVGDKIQGTSTTYRVLGLFSFGDNQYADGVDYGVSGFSSFFDFYGDAKSAAAYKATTDYGADVIIAPKYVIDEVDYFVFKRINVLVEGYRGTVTSIR